MSDEPLHVQVARALGCAPVHRSDGPYKSDSYIACGCKDHPHGVDFDEDGAIHSDQLAVYGEDSPEGWACTGPLMVRCKISLFYNEGPVPWEAEVDDEAYMVQTLNPCEAIALLVVKLAADGRLPK